MVGGGGQKRGCSFIMLCGGGWVLDFMQDLRGKGGWGGEDRALALPPLLLGSGKSGA